MEKKKKLSIATIVLIALIGVIIIGTVVSLTAAESSESSTYGAPGAGGPPSGGQAPGAGGPPSGDEASGGDMSFAQSGASTSSSTATAVEVYEVENGTVQRSIKTNGDVLPGSEVEIYSDVAGKILNYNVSLGQRITSGTQIARVDPSKPGQSYSPNPVLSTASGTVSELSNVAGDTVDTSTVIAIISDFDNLRVSTSIPERYVSYIEVGLNAELTLEAYEDESFSATITKVSPMLDSSTRSLDIELEVDDPQKLVRAGMFAELRLVIQEAADVLVVPTEAIVDGDNGDAIYTIDADGNAKLTDVTLGLKGTSSVEVVSGLELGDYVVVKGQSFLSDGDPVRIVAGLDEE